MRCLEKRGAVKKDKATRWKTFALAVRKPGTDTLWLTVDLRGVNKETTPVASSRADFEYMCRPVAGSQVFFKLDMCQAYWQIPLSPE